MKNHANFASVVVDFSLANGNLEEIAAVLGALDDYVAVSNTNVHIAAALGKRARILVPGSAREWRWGREGPSPWFPDFTIYRQPDSGDWSQAIGELRRDLASARVAS